MLTIEKLLEILSNGKGEFVCTYGTGRIESYSIDASCMSGYDSSGKYRHIFLNDDDFDVTEMHTISEVTKVWSKDA